MNRLCYQVATPDVAVSDSVTAYQGQPEEIFRELSALGYGGVEFMTLDPGKLDVEGIRRLLARFGLACTVVCTGEIYGQLGLSYTDPAREIREEAVERTKGIIDFASALGANINIGRIRGHYSPELARGETEDLAVRAFRELSDYAAPRGVSMALETVTIMQTDFINTLAEAEEIIRRVDRGNFRLMMDVFHMNLEEKDLFAAIRDHSRYNIHVHLADNNRRYPGQCGLDFAKIIRTFYECGYRGDFTTEIYQLPDMRAAAKGAAEHLIPIIREVYGT